MAGKPQPPEPRFWKRLGDVTKLKSSDCWNWGGYVDKKGYGRLSVNHRLILAHRYSWKLLIGELPENKCVLHRCDNPSCVNPKHLFLGTIQDNNADMVRKGRARKAVGEQASMSKLCAVDVQTIRELYKTGRYTTRDLGRKFHVTHTPIVKIINRETWKHIP